MVVLALIASTNATRAAEAAEHSTFLRAPALAQPPAAKNAAQFQLKISLPEGRGLARALLDAGVNQHDAGTAARLAAGHLGMGEGGCFATISIERNPSGGFSLMRVQLSTQARQTVIERRGSELTVAADNPTSRSPALV